MIIENNGATWKMTGIAPGHRLYQLSFSDKYHLELAWHQEKQTATVSLCDEKGKISEATTDKAYSAIKAQQWACLYMSEWLHNTALTSKQIETALVHSSAWKELASQTV